MAPLPKHVDLQGDFFRRCRHAKATGRPNLIFFYLIDRRHPSILRNLSSDCHCCTKTRSLRDLQDPSLDFSVQFPWQGGGGGGGSGRRASITTLDSSSTLCGFRERGREGRHVLDAADLKVQSEGGGHQIDLEWDTVSAHTPTRTPDGSWGQILFVRRWSERFFSSPVVAAYISLPATFLARGVWERKREIWGKKILSTFYDGR